MAKPIRSSSVYVRCTLRMGKSCCAPGCENRWSKRFGLSFYLFPADPVKRARWVAAVSRKNWEHTEYSWLCSVHFVSGSKSNDKLSPDYVPSIFSHTKSPIKRKAEQNLHAYTRKKEARKRRSEALKIEAASQIDLLSLAKGNTETLKDDEGSTEGGNNLFIDERCCNND